MKRTRADAFKHVAQLILDAPIAGIRQDAEARIKRFMVKPDDELEHTDYHDMRYFEWTWAFGVSANLEIQGTYMGEKVRVLVHWSSGGGEVSRAVATNSLRQQVTDLAAHIETFFDDTEFEGEEKRSR